jgi:predicted glycosyltransferase
MGEIDMRAPRAFIYVQHLLGIGHLVRANRIASALVDDGFEVAVATGGLPVPGFPGPGIRTIALAPIKAGSGGFSALEDAKGRPVDDDFKLLRSNELIAALQDFKPDAVIVETFPFGRRAMRFELLPFLEAALLLSRRPLIACSVRDILQQNHKPGRLEETVDTIEKYFDIVLVHSDPSYAALGETFPLADALTSKIHYTGLVAGPHPAAPSERYDIVISAGGGAVGRELVVAAAQMAKQLDKGIRCCLITGPNIPPLELGSLKAGAGPDLEIFSFRDDFPSLLVGARLSVSQAGYNTLCDILRAGCRSLLIPFAKGGETEQTSRALRLEKLGLAHVLREDELSASALSRAVQIAIGKPAPLPHGFNLEGAKQTAALIRSRI